MRIRIEFEIRDLWVGAYWCRKDSDYYCEVEYDVYVCLVPMFPIHFSWQVPWVKE